MTTTRQSANQWWESATVNTKSVFSGIVAEVATNYHYRVWWSKLTTYVKNLIHNYYRYRIGETDISEDEVYSLQIELITEIADIELQFITDKKCEDMSDEQGAYHEQYQDLFNRIYDEIESRILDSELV